MTADVGSHEVERTLVARAEKCRRIAVVLLALPMLLIPGTGAALTLLQSDYWEYQWVNTRNISGYPSRFESGRVRYQLSNPTVIDGVLIYDLTISGRGHYIGGINTPSERDLLMDWERMGVDSSGAFWGTRNGSSNLERIYRPDYGTWDDVKGLFRGFSSADNVTIGSGSVTDGIWQGTATKVAQDISEGENCVRLPGGTYVCDGEEDSSRNQVTEYWRSDIGPVAGFYESDAFFGPPAPSIHRTEREIGMVATSLQGDSYNYALEMEPSSFATAAALPNESTLVVGSVHEDDDSYPISITGVSDNIPVHDWYSFQLNQGRMVSVDLDWSDVFGATDLDLIITDFPLTDSPAQSVADNVGSGIYHENVSVFLGPGNWRIGVSGFSTNNTAVEYQLSHNIVLTHVAIQASPPTVAPGQLTQVSWSANTNGCSLSYPVGGGLSTTIPVQGVGSVDSRLSSNGFYRVSCFDGNSSDSDHVTVFVVPEPGRVLSALTTLGVLVALRIFRVNTFASTPRSSATHGLSGVEPH